MDYTRHCYSAPCQWYPDGPVGRIRYYIVPATNKRLLDLTVFWPYDNELQLENQEGVGERTGKENHPYYRGTNQYPSRNGAHIHGDLRYFNGELPAPWGADPMPAESLVGCDVPGVYVFPVNPNALRPGLGLRGLAPNVGISGAPGFPLTVLADAGTVTLRGLPPLVRLPLAQLSLAGHVPTIVAETGLPAGSLEVAGQDPTLSASTSVTVPAASLDLAGLPGEAGDTLVLPAGLLTLGGEYAGLSASSTLDMPAADLRLSGQQCVPAVVVAVAPPAASLDLAGQALTLSASSSLALPVAADLTLTGLAPASISTGIAAPAGSLLLTGLVPSLSASSTIATPAGALTLAGLAPSFSVSILPPAGALVLSGLVPSLSASSTLAPPESDLRLSGQQATFVIAIEPPAGELELTGLVPTVTAVGGGPTPGVDCDHAGSFTPPLNYSDSVTAPGSHWFKFNASSGVTYHMTFSQTGGFFTTATVWGGGNCLSLSNLGSTTGGCVSWTQGADEIVFIQVAAGMFGTANYTVIVDTGPCP